MKLVHDTSSSAVIRPYSPEKALGLIVDLKLTKEEYITMKLGAKNRGANIYPSYHVIAEAKRKNNRKKPKKIKAQFNEVVLGMLKLPTFNSGDDDGNDDEESDDDDAVE
ncbi:hypothetical protein RN001_006024 [Aquatica leii]|uniref:Uncharacterized protein n=1 Tax=Aquatica leii TaxID=1421715 RepID=A0AAN7SS63_9COLE|nr:hypothetical protein RN001_006024 [Aquatica leii]